MLLRFTFSNYRSFRKEQEFSLVAQAESQSPVLLTQGRPSEFKVLPVAAIYGSNASGKTNVLRALHFMKLAVMNSHRLWKPDEGVPRDPFRFDVSGRSANSTFSIDFLIEGRRFQYGFQVDDERIVSEWLYTFSGSRRFSWFNRPSNGPIRFGRGLDGPNKLVEALLRENSLFLSAAAQNGHKALMPMYRFFSKSLRFETDEREISAQLIARLSKDGRFRDQLSEVLRLADMGIASVRTRNRQLKNEEVERFHKVFSALGVDKEKDVARITETVKEMASTSVELLHRAGEQLVPLPLSEESNGTRAFLSLLVPILDALSDGSSVCVDELEASLHPLLANWLIRQFQNVETNPNSAQLIFNTHETQLLGELLGRDQIWFTEKDSHGESHMYPLSDFRIRPNENLETGYMQGRYGAIPFISSRAVLSMIGERDADL